MPPFEPRKGVAGGLPTFFDQLSSGLQKGKCMFVDRFSSQPLILQYGTQAAPVTVPALPTAAADGINVLNFPGGLGNDVIEMHQTTAQTLMPSIHASKGMEIALDQVDNETVEYVPGGNRASNPFLYVAGTDPGVFIEAIFELPVAAFSDQFGIGYRKQENYATPTSWLSGGAPVYTDAALFGFAGAAATPNTIRLSTTVGSAVAVVSSSGFTVPNNGIVKLRMHVRGRAVTCFINGHKCGDRIAADGLGAAITAQNSLSVNAYSFTSGLSLIPFIFVRQDAGLGALYLRSLTVGQGLEFGYDDAGRGPQ